MKERRCVNHSDRPVHPPSKVLCRECFAELDRKMRGLERQLFGSSEQERESGVSQWFTATDKRLRRK